MKYNSTRGGVFNASFEDVLFSGYAPDGGLFVPEFIPNLDETTLRKWKELKLSYPEVMENVLRLYVPNTEISDKELSVAIANAQERFSKPVIPIATLKKPNGSVINVVELFHGPSKSFKDMALSLVGQFMQHFMEKRNRHVTVLVGTSGDTGSAAIESVSGMSKVDIVVLYPKGMVTEVQELQMRSPVGDNIHLFEVEGTSDDLDIPIGKCFPDPTLTCVNSINWARILIQICHYVYLYVTDEGEGPIHVVAPTGAGGNITAGAYAKLMGVPVQLHVACNVNSCVHVLLSKGILEMGKETIPTPANAMDICNPYNVERLLYLASDPTTVSALMRGKGMQIIAPEVKANLHKMVAGSESIESKSIYEAMTYAWDKFNYMICPHTATAFKYALNKISGDCYILATASPLKFPEASIEAGIPAEKWNAYELQDALRLLPLRSTKIMRKGDDWLKILKDEISLINHKSSG